MEKKEFSKSERVVKLIVVLAYLFIVFLAFFDFYNLDDGNEIGYTLLYFYFLLPIITFIISFYVGKDKNLNNFKWLMVILFGIVYMSPLFCLVLTGDSTIKEVFTSYYDMIFNGVLISLIGMIIGTTVKIYKNKRKNKKDK